MNTVKLFCIQKDLADIMAYMMKSNVKYWPVRRHVIWNGNEGVVGYILEMEKEHYIVPFLILKFDLKLID